MELLQTVAAGVRPASLRTQLAAMADADQRDPAALIAVPTVRRWGDDD